MSLVGFASFGAEDPHVCGDARGQGRIDGEEEGEVRVCKGECDRLRTWKKVKLHRVKRHPKRYGLKASWPARIIHVETRQENEKVPSVMNDVVS